MNKKLKTILSVSALMLLLTLSFAYGKTIMAKSWLYTELFGDDGMVMLSAHLDGESEFPPNESQAVGDGTFLLDNRNNLLFFKINYSGLEGEGTVAHIHGPADTGENAEALIELPMGDPISGVWNYSQDLETAILNGEMYVNIHSDVYPEGEIRGQISEVNVMPLATFE